MNHYEYCDLHIRDILAAVGVNMDHGYSGIVSAHGDKAYGYSRLWQDHDIPFNHGVAMFLLSYSAPFLKEIRDTPAGWVRVQDWVVANYRQGHNFITILPPTD